MDSTLNQIPKNGLKPIETVNEMAGMPKLIRYLYAFDLVNVGLSSTFAIGICFGIGYVVRHVAGPSAILSIMLAAFIAYFVGAFYTELNTTIVLSAIKWPKTLSQVMVTASSQTTDDVNHYNTSTNSNRQFKPTIPNEFLLASYQLTYIIHDSKLVAFVIAWNLIMEYIVIVALISKALIIYIDALFFSSMGHLNQIIPMEWYLGKYFDVCAMFIPIVIGVPLLLILRWDTILNAISNVLTLLIVIILFCVSLFNADISNWYQVDTANNHEDSTLASDGFYAFGVDGVFRGVIIILFVFNTFDVMLMSRSHDFVRSSKRYSNKTGTGIQHFGRTIISGILSINTTIFLSLLAMAFALTVTHPLHLMDKSIPLLSMIDVLFTENEALRVAIRFIILIAGSIALVGSLYAMLHAEQRIFQTMLSTDTDDSTFKLFGKFSLSHLQQEIRLQCDESNIPTNRRNDITNTITTTNIQPIGAERHRKQQHRQFQWRMYTCFVFSILSGLLAGLFDLEHLINLLSIGTLLMLFILTIDIMILRHSTECKQRLLSTFNNESSSSHTKSTYSMSLLTILLSIYCFLAATLTIFIKLVTSNTITVSTTIFWIFIVILIVGLFTVVLFVSTQSNGNAIFSFNLSHPLFPALILFGCIYLCTSTNVAAWIRFTVWMVIGAILYIMTLKTEDQPQKVNDLGMTNDGFVSDVDTIHSQSSDDRLPSEETLQLEERSVSYPVNINNENENVKNDNSNWNESVNQASNEITVIHSNEDDNAIEMEEIVKKSTIETKKHLEEIDTSVNVVTVVEQKSYQKDYLNQLKLDEISSVDDVKHTCIERREPNGTTYFVQVIQIRNDSSENDIETQYADINQNSLCNEVNDDIIPDLEQNIVNRVCHQSDVDYQPDSKSIEYQEIVSSLVNDSESEEEIEVRAIVHAPNGYLSPSNTPPPTPNIDLNENENALQSPNFQIGVYEAIPKQKLLFANDKNRLAFKTRLENLFGQNDGTTIFSPAKSNFNSPKSIHSNRISYGTQRLNHSISAPESLHMPVDETISNVNTSINMMPSQIPKAPVFNQQLFDTIGRRNRNAFPPIPNVTDINGPISIDDSYKPPESMRKGNLLRSKAHENLNELDSNDDDDDENNDKNIRQKLEHIFSRGQRTQVTNVTELDSNQNENIQRNKRHEPFDTVRKQKMRFSTVLKSIVPDIHTNLHPTQTTAAIDIQNQQKRESLDLNEQANSNPLKTM